MAAEEFVCTFLPSASVTWCACFQFEANRCVLNT